MNWLLIFGGGFLLYEYLTGGFSSTPAAATSTTATPTGTSTTTAANSAGAANSPTLTLVANAAAAAGYPAGSLLDYDQWNYYYTKVRGVPGPDMTNVWPNRPRAYAMTVQEWWAGAQSLGLSGLRGNTGGMGNYVRVKGYGAPRRMF